MESGQSQLGWSEAQWNKVAQAVTEEFNKASVAGAILPCFGPLADSTESVRAQKLRPSPNNYSAVITVDDDDTLKLWTLRVFVHLKHEQVADPNLTSALLAFRRAANTVARGEDYIVFNGYDNTSATRVSRDASRPSLTQNYSIPQGDLDDIVPKENQSAQSVKGLIDKQASAMKQVKLNVNKQQDRTDLVEKIAEAVGDLERRGYPGPHACVLGNKMFVEAHTPTGSLVMPADRITPILKGPLLRSSEIDTESGVVVSSAAEPIDLVVATAPKAQFLQVNADAKYVFRVYERFVLRIKDDQAVVPLKFK